MLPYLLPYSNFAKILNFASLHSASSQDCKIAQSQISLVASPVAMMMVMVTIVIMVMMTIVIKVMMMMIEKLYCQISFRVGLALKPRFHSKGSIQISFYFLLALEKMMLTITMLKIVTMMVMMMNFARLPSLKFY